MKRNFILSLLAAAALAGALPAAGAVPLRVNYQGKLEDGGAPVTGTRSFVFKLYDALTGGTLLWTSQTHSVGVVNGVFSVVLQTGTPVNLSTATFAGARYVELTVDGTLLSPREEVVSAPYALVAQALSSNAVIGLANLEKDPSALSTVNTATNPVDWSSLKSVPAGFADGVDDTGGALTSKEGGVTTLTPTTTLDFTAAQFDLTAAAPTTLITLAASSVTLQGNAFNGVSQLVQLDGAGKLPVLDGSALTSVTASVIADGAVTLAKMANMATASILGRNTAGSGAPEVLNAATIKSILALNNVDNTSLASWTGTANITTLGTIGTGSWNATAIPDGKIAAALTGKTYNGLTLTAQAVGFTAAGGTTSKTLTVSNTADVSGTNTGDQTITLTGDVTGSGTGSFAATIGAGKVTLAQMANMATASILGRNTAGSGAPEVLNAATIKSILALNNVDNTSLASWTGTANITTLGTIGTGSWNATAIPDGKIAAALTGKTYNGLTLTAQAVGFTAAGGTTSKTLTVSNTADVSGTNTGDQTITLTGDVTGSGTGSFAATIGAGKVTLAQMANMATASLLGRNTAGSGAPEVLDVTTAKTLLGLGGVSGTNTGDQTITLTGDVTGSGTGSFAATIGAGKVTLAQMANMATASILGRNTAGSGAPEVLNAATIKSILALNNVDNTSLASWTGTANITTLGTIGTGSWNATAIPDAKIDSTLTGKTYNGLTLTAQAVGFTAAGGTTSKTLTVSNTADVSGTNTGDQTITLTGDVTGSGTGSFAATIGDGKVTDAKVATIAAYKAKHTPIFIIDADYTVTSTDTIVLAAGVSLATSVTLPTASAATVGKEYIVYVLDTTAAVTVKTDIADFVNGAKPWTKTPTAYQAIRILGIQTPTNYEWVASLQAPTP